MHPRDAPDWKGVDKPWLDEAEAVLWHDGRIVATGGTNAITAKASSLGATVLDLDGRVVLPGFVDAHTHFLHIGVKKTRPDLREATSLEDALARVAAWLKQHPGTAHVIAEGWDESDWPRRVRPSRHDLDLVAAKAGQANRPIVLRRICGHVAVANSAALPFVRKRWDSDDLVDLDTGVLLEASSLYLNEVLAESAAALDLAITEASRVCHSLGITTVGDYSQAPYRAALLRAAAEDRLTIRVASSIYVQQLANEVKEGFRTGRRAAGPRGSDPTQGQVEAASRSGRALQGQAGAATLAHGPPRQSEWMQDGGLKVFHDGSLGARTAALRTKYIDAPAGLAADCGGERRSTHGCVGHPHPNGTLNWSDLDVARYYRTANAAGIQLHAHAIGDAAIDQGLDAFEGILPKLAGKPGMGTLGQIPLEWGAADAEAVAPTKPTEVATKPTEEPQKAAIEATKAAANPLRSRFEHFEIVHDDQIERAARLGVVASSQPNFVGTWSSKGGMYEERLGAKFSVNNRFRAFKAAGIPVAFGSDGMPPGPLAGIDAAVNHPDPAQRMTALEAIWHYTWAAAWSLHWEKDIGSLAPGKCADFVVLDEKTLDSAPKDWRIMETISGGVSRYPSKTTLS